MIIADFMLLIPILYYIFECTVVIVDSFRQSVVNLINVGTFLILIIHTKIKIKDFNFIQFGIKVIHLKIRQPIIGIGSSWYLN